MKYQITRSDEGKLVRDFLIHDRAFSHRLLKKVKRDGEILVNGQPITVRHLLSSGEELEVILPNEKTGHIEPIKMSLDIVYEDDAILVVSKPQGLAMSPNMNDKLTLANGIMYYYRSIGLNRTVHIVTRLDKNTSGLVLIAKSSHTHQLLMRQQIHRVYRALVEGHLKQKKGTIDLPIARNLPSIIERKVDPNGKRAITHYEVIQEFKQYSLLNIKLETGRTHQIRVHFSYLGNPLVGDDLYGGQPAKLKGQALHCQWLKLKHPIHKKRLIFYSSAPKEWINI